MVTILKYYSCDSISSTSREPRIVKKALLFDVTGTDMH